jgi:hypothetical protein
LYKSSLILAKRVSELLISYKCFVYRGFGAKYKGEVRHCFQCGSKEEVDGIDGILQAYHETFKSGLVMSGPTDFSEVIMTAGALASSRQVQY